MITLTETFTPTIGEPRVTIRKFQTRQAFKKALRLSPISTQVAYDLLKKGRAEVEYSNGIAVIVLEEEPKLIIVE